MKRLVVAALHPALLGDLCPLNPHAAVLRHGTPTDCSPLRRLRPTEVNAKPAVVYTALLWFERSTQTTGANPGGDKGYIPTVISKRSRPTHLYRIQGGGEFRISETGFAVCSSLWQLGTLEPHEQRYRTRCGNYAIFRKITILFISPTNDTKFE